MYSTRTPGHGLVPFQRHPRMARETTPDVIVDLFRRAKVPAEQIR